MSQLITISRDDKQFWPMLTGRFSKTHFAQPVKNLYVNSADETVTFKIIEKNSLSLTGALAQWYSLARNIYLIFPILGGISYLTATYGVGELDLIISSVLGLQTFLMSLTLYNDYSDYINGVDRVNDYSSKKPLIQGLVRPYQAQQLAVVLLGASVLFSLYCFIQRPMTLVFALLALGIGFFFSSPIINKKYKGLSVVMTFILAGPLLVTGYEYLLFEQFSWASVTLGFVFGLHALKYDFCKQVRDIYYSSKAHVYTVSNYVGFERSKWIYTLLSITHLVALSFFAYTVDRLDLYALVVVGICFEAYINHLFIGAHSFLSSNIGYCLGLQKLHYTMENCLLVFFFLSPLWLSLL